MSICPSPAAFPSPAGVGAAAVCCPLGHGCSGTPGTVETQIAFQQNGVLQRSAFAQTATTGLQSPLDAVVIHMLLTGCHLKMRYESSENDRFFCFGEKMSPKGSLLDVSLPFRHQKVVSQ